ncbi:MAG: hypothetical protein HEQ21_18440 [Blastomonas sp.]|uniref:hypothetical protein n=3 Tax=Blastomonas TaxID=150203 RepID=UPI00258BBDC3|nr:hypothetical protein [Blastomonas sp.]MCO5794798.1 hypothetical protein [Blastomonas sp.]
MSITDDDLEQKFVRFAEPKQILFLSADLVGSTALKQKKRKQRKRNVHHPDTQEWATTLQFFFTSLGHCFDKKWSERKAHLLSLKDATLVEKRLGTKPILWKTIGDELVYRKYVANRHQAKECIDIWINAIQELYKRFEKDLKNPEISIKSTAWVGEFPIQNKVLVGVQFSGFSGQDGNSCGPEHNAKLEKATIAEGATRSQKADHLGTSPAQLLDILDGFESNPVKNGVEIDFIGPAIDIGFRLTKKATPRKFVLSIDAVFLYVLSELSGDGGSLSNVKINYDGSEILQGVLGGLPYPIFWIDMSKSDSSEVIADQFLFSKNPIDKNSIYKYCMKFYEEKLNYVDRPYIMTDDGVSKTLINKLPKWYDIERTRLKKDFFGPR